jgi:PAS domain S-box-containing protein
MMVVLSLVVVSTSAIFTVLLVHFRTTDLIGRADASLLTAAELTRELVGPAYHDAIVDETSVSAAHFRSLVARNDALCRRLRLQYLWSVLRVGDRLVFTSATHSDLNDPKSPCAAFFEPHRNPQSFALALRPELKPSFSSFENEWGAGRQVLVPYLDARGRTYVFCASVQLTEFNAMVRRTALTSIGMGVGVLGGALLVALLLARSFTVPIARLTAAAGRMATGDLDVPLASAGTRELQSLSSSLDEMRTGLKRQLESLQKSERRLSDVIDFLPDATLAIDGDKKVIVWNKAMEKMTGIKAEAMIGQGNYAYTIPFYGERRPQFMDLIWQHDPSIIEKYSHVTRDGDSLTAEAFCSALYGGRGGQIWVKVSPLHDPTGKVVGAIESIRDITERKRAEEALRQSQKIDSVGRLAGGVAHDFNNMLGVILGHAELVLETMAPEQPGYADLREIQAAARRSAALTRQLLGFARKQMITLRVLDLNETVDGMLKMLSRLIGENLELVWRPGKELWPVWIDPCQVDQVLVNLCVNARDAIVGVGIVTIATENVAVDAAGQPEHAEAVPGDYVRLTAVDTGGGMEKEVLAHLFEPFFTTKELGKGTGLGLATVYGIVKQNGGFITVHSMPGQGATFQLYLPRYQSPPGTSVGLASERCP